MLATIVGHGGWILVLIICSSLAAMAVAIERAWRLWPLRSTFTRSWDELEASLLRRGVGATQRLVDRPSNAMQRVAARALAHAEHGRELVREAGFEAAQREVAGIERGLRIVATVAQVAPLMGLLGTVVGLIETFREVGAAAETGMPSGALADGIYLALGTTAAGLCVAIPAWIVYNALTGLASRLIDQLEHAAGELPLLVERRA